MQQLDGGVGKDALIFPYILDARTEMLGAKVNLIV
jgi:hypothetical protein